MSTESKKDKIESNPKFLYYHYMDIIKNTLHRHLSVGLEYKAFFPRFYYSWFFVDERTLYNIATLKQRLGPNIDQKDVDAYNHMRVK